MIDAKWLDALKLPLKATIAVALASGILLACDLKGWMDLGPLGSFVRPILFVAVVVSAVLSAVNAVDLALAPRRERRHVTLLTARRAVRKREQHDASRECQARAIAWLDSLSRQELHIVVQCLRGKSPTFYSHLQDPAMQTLRSKGLGWTPAGNYNLRQVPFIFHDFAWMAIQGRRDEFLAKDAVRE